MLWNAILILAGALAEPPGGSSWQWPLRPPVSVLRPFDPPTHPWEPGHRGVDLAARPGQAVYAAGPGRVGFARDLAGRGVVTVLHGRLRTTYLPVHPSVRTGQAVAAGTRIGVVENVLGHCGASPCLHWGLREGVTYFDPLTLVGRGPVRLLPWWRDAVHLGGEALDGATAWDDPARAADRGPASTQIGSSSHGPDLPPTGPYTPFALVTDVLATTMLRPGLPGRGGPPPNYPQGVTPLARRVAVRQIRRRR
jgi:murein DD-endopeptidase MepM/ murein hydrolase activator NlpD